MADYSGLIVIAALGGAALLFGPKIMDAINQAMPTGGGDAGAGAQPAAGGDTSAPATATSTTNIIAPTPLGVGYPLIGYPGYPYGYAPYGGYPWAWPPVIGHFSAPRWFNNYPRFPGYGGYPYPRPHPGPRFLGPPVPAPGPHH